MTKACESNPFCCRLADEVREALCRHCVKCTYAKDTSIPAQYTKPFLVLEGVTLVENQSRPIGLFGPGTINTSIHFTPERYKEIVVPGPYEEEQHENARHIFLADSVYAVFSNRIFRELMEEASFLSVLYDFDISQLNQTMIYMRYLYQVPLDETVRYVLKYAEHLGLTGLTHAKIARLAGKSRPAVTQALGRLCLSDPELPNVL